MRVLSFTVTLAFSFALVATAAIADPIKERKEIMKQHKKSAATIGKMMKGAEPYDAAGATKALQTVASTTDKFVKLFPEGSKEDPSSESKYFAKEDVWTKMEDFLAKGEDLKKAAGAAAKTTSLDELKVAAKDVFAACKDCHESYRGKK